MRRGLAYLMVIVFLWVGGGYAAVLDKPDILEVVEVSGVIADSTGKSLEKQIEDIERNPKVKALFLILDSPGGGVVATHNAYEALGKTKLPVVVWCDTLCASGGLYLAMASSVKWLAMRDLTLSGSMGVYMSLWRYHRLLEWAKIDPIIFKSGEFKDAGSGDRPMTEQEKAYLQSIVDQLATRFSVIVFAKRPTIGAADQARLKTARIVFGHEAVTMGLADAVMTKDQAIRKAKELSGSKTIYTREELRKMAEMAQEGPGSRTSGYGYAPPGPPNPFGDVPWLIEWLKDIQRGETIRLEYRMPYGF